MKTRFLYIILFSFWGFISVMSQPVSSSTGKVNIQHFGDADGFYECLVTYVIQDHEGVIWLATWDGLKKYDGYRFTTYKAHPGDGCPLKSNRFNYIEETTDHHIVCWSGEDYYLFNRHTEKFEPYSGNIKAKVYVIPEEISRFYKSLPEYKNINPHFLLIDKQQGVWIYTYRGLERVSISAKPLVPEKSQYGSAEEYVRGLFVDKQKRLWVSDKNGYVRIYEKESGSRAKYLAPSGQLSAVPVCFGANVYCFFEDHLGQIWMGTKPQGLYRLVNKGSNTLYAVTQFLPQSDDDYSISSNAIYDIKEDSHHRLILATYGGGLNIAEPRADGTVRFIHYGNLLKSFPKDVKNCRCLELMQDGTLLIGSDNGLLSVSLNKTYSKMRFYHNVRNPHVKSSLGNNLVMDLLRDRKGEVYLTTSGGGVEKILSQNYLSDQLQFHHYSVQEGLSSDVTMSLAEDKDSALWIVSEASLSRLNTRSGVSTNYQKTFFDGGFVFTEATPVCLPDSLMIIATSQGVLRFNPRQIAKSDYIPHIVFSCADHVELPAGKQDFHVSFAAIDYNKNENIIYAYMMAGIDDDWHYTSAHELNYVGLKPGTYKLHVKSTNGDGIWVDNERIITLKRKAKFNETPWAWMLYGSLLALTLICVVWVVRYIRKLQKEIKDIRLTNKEQIEMLGYRIRELLPTQETPEEIHAVNNHMSEDDLLFSQKLKSYVEENVDNADLSVSDIASAMNVSRTVLYARVRKLFDSTPNNYVLNTRIDYAKRLLTRDGVPVSDVAYRCGFSNPKYFSRCFKKLTGKRPSEYNME